MIGAMLALALLQSQPSAACADACGHGGRCCGECEAWVALGDRPNAQRQVKKQLDDCLAKKREAAAVKARAPDCSTACAGGSGPCCPACMSAASACTYEGPARCDAATSEYEACVPAAGAAAARWAIPKVGDGGSRRRVLYSVQLCYFSQERESALAGIKDEKEAAKIAGIVDKAKLYELQGQAHNAEETLAQLHSAFRGLQLKPFPCNSEWLAHLVECMHRREDSDGCNDEPWKSVRSDLP